MSWLLFRTQVDLDIDGVCDQLVPTPVCQPSTPRLRSYRLAFLRIRIPVERSPKCRSSGVQEGDSPGCAIVVGDCEGSASANKFLRFRKPFQAVQRSSTRPPGAVSSRFLSSPCRPMLPNIVGCMGQIVGVRFSAGGGRSGVVDSPSAEIQLEGAFSTIAAQLPSYPSECSREPARPTQVAWDGVLDDLADEECRPYQFIEVESGVDA